MRSAWSGLGLGWSVWPVVPVASLVFKIRRLLVIITTFLTRQISCMMIMWPNYVTQVVKSSQWCWQTQAPMSLYVRIILETLLQLFKNFQCHTPIDLRYRQGWKCRPSYLTSWDIQKISCLDLNKSIESTAVDKLLQIITISINERKFLKIIITSIFFTV